MVYFAFVGKRSVFIPATVMIWWNVEAHWRFVFRIRIYFPD